MYREARQTGQLGDVSNLGVCEYLLSDQYFQPTYFSLKGKTVHNFLNTNEMSIVHQYSSSHGVLQAQQQKFECERSMRN